MSVAMMVFLLVNFGTVRDLGLRSVTVGNRGLPMMTGGLVCGVLMEPSVRDRRRRRGKTAEQGDDERYQVAVGRAHHKGKPTKREPDPPVVCVRQCRNAYGSFTHK